MDSGRVIAPPCAESVKGPVALISGFRDMAEAESPLLDIDALLMADDPDTVVSSEMTVADEEDLEEDAPESIDGRLDPGEVGRRLDELGILYRQALTSLTEYGVQDHRTQALRQQLREYFLQFCLTPVVLNHLINGLHDRAGQTWRMLDQARGAMDHQPTDMLEQEMGLMALELVELDRCKRRRRKRFPWIFRLVTR
jgi:hypothetical protein